MTRNLAAFASIIKEVYDKMYNEQKARCEDATKRGSIAGQAAYATSCAALTMFMAELRCADANKKV